MYYDLNVFYYKLFAVFAVYCLSIYHNYSKTTQTSLIVNTTLLVYNAGHVMRTSRPPSSASKYLINIKQQAGCFDKTVDGFIYKFDTAEYDMSLL